MIGERERGRIGRERYEGRVDSWTQTVIEIESRLHIAEADQTDPLTSNGSEKI